MRDVLAAWALNIDAVFSFVGGLILFFAPDKVGNFAFRRSTDGIHWHLLRCVGGQMIASAFIFRRLGGRAPETQTTCFLLRVTSAILAIFLFWHVESTNPGLVDPMVTKALNWISYLSIVSSFMFLIWSGWPLGKDLYNSPVQNVLYQLDSLASVTIGMAWISNPKWLLHRQVLIELDASHELCGRIMGVMFVCSQVLAGHALYWRARADRSLAAEARAICCIFILTAQIWSQVAYGAHWSGGHWIGISLFSTWTLISILYRVAICFDYADPTKTTKGE